MQLHCADFINLSKQALQAVKHIWDIKLDCALREINKEIAQLQMLEQGLFSTTGTIPTLSCLCSCSWSLSTLRLTLAMGNQFFSMSFHPATS